MSIPLVRQRCWTHPGREAVSRCPECGRFYCRECVTEHDGRLLCTACLATLAAASAKRKGTRWIMLGLAAALGLWAVFLFYYSAGHLLQQIPTTWARGVEEE